MCLRIYTNINNAYLKKVNMYIWPNQLLQDQLEIWQTHLHSHASSFSSSSISRNYPDRQKNVCNNPDTNFWNFGLIKSFFFPQKKTSIETMRHRFRELNRKQKKKIVLLIKYIPKIQIYAKQIFRLSAAIIFQPQQK